MFSKTLCNQFSISHTFPVVDYAKLLRKLELFLFFDMRFKVTKDFFNLMILRNS